MQVLQRLDLFTDTGLRDQLGAHLSPIVERASAQLVATINRELGELVRGYVAEAIEREIDTWRNREPQKPGRRCMSRCRDLLRLARNRPPVCRDWLRANTRRPRKLRVFDRSRPC